MSNYMKSPDQVEKLVKALEANLEWSPEMREQIEKDTGLSSKAVKNWYYVNKPMAITKRREEKEALDAKVEAKMKSANWALQECASQAFSRSLNLTHEPSLPMEDQWVEFLVGSRFPTELPFVRALNRPLETLTGLKPNQYVAKWHEPQTSHALMGRIWNENGKIAANFSSDGREYRNNIGSLQVLMERPENERGFNYDWKPYGEAAKFGEKEWHPVHENSIAPAVLMIDDKEVLGQVDIGNERASVSYNGGQVLTGPNVHSCQVLCRRNKF